MIKINAGCAEDIKEGYINIDLHPEEYPLIKDKILPADVRNMPFKDNTVDEVYASHIIEHFNYKDAILCLIEWCRILKTGGQLTVIVPDFNTLAHKWIDEYSMHNRLQINAAIYGSQRGVEQYHKSAWDGQILYSVLQETGFSDITMRHWKYDVWLRGDGYKGERHD